MVSASPPSWVVSTVLCFAALIGILFSFITVRRLILYPFALRSRRRAHSYRRLLSEYCSTPGYDRDDLIEALEADPFIDRGALEEVIIEALESCGEEDRAEDFSAIYSRFGLVEWRRKQLDSVWPWKRRIAADRLGRSFCRDAVIPLMMCLRDPDEDVRTIAARALVRMNAVGSIDYIVSLLKDLPDEKCLTVTDILIYFGREAVPSIVQSLHTPDLKSRFWLTRALAEIDFSPADRCPPEWTDKIKTLLTDPVDRIRAYGAVAMGRTRAAEAQDLITPLIRDGSVLVRMNACRALGLIDKPETATELVTALGDPAWEVQWEAAQSLRLYRERILPLLRQQLKHPRNTLRKWARELMEGLPET